MAWTEKSNKSEGTEVGRVNVSLGSVCGSRWGAVGNVESDAGGLDDDFVSEKLLITGSVQGQCAGSYRASELDLAS